MLWIEQEAERLAGAKRFKKTKARRKMASRSRARNRNQPCEKPTLILEVILNADKN